MRTHTTLFLILLFACGVFAGKKEEREAAANRARVDLLNRIESLKAVYWKYHAEFREKSEKRWQQQQMQLERKEENKKSAESIRQQLELLYADIARKKEEALAKEQAMESEKGMLKDKRELWTYLEQQMEEKIDKTAKANQGWFPLEMEERARRIAGLERSSGERSAIYRLEQLFDLRCNWLKESASIGVMRRTFVPERLDPVTGQVLRIGNSFAFAQDVSGSIYALNATGGSRTNRFEWRKITEPELLKRITDDYTGWMRERKVKGAVPVDILQNEKSRNLVGTEETTLVLKAKDFLRAGGPVLIPLGLILLWAFFLILERFAVYFFRHRRNARTMAKVMKLLHGNDLESIKALVGKKSGLAAGLARICLKQKNQPRETVEKSIEEYLLVQAPKLDKNLDTISVLAGAAPLLGLLGTVTGMIRLFQVITEVGTGDPKMMAGGISEALITTECGLAIAIPLVLVHNWLRSRRNTLLSDAEMYAMQFLNRLRPQGQKGPVDAQALSHGANDKQLGYDAHRTVMPQVPKREHMSAKEKE